MDNDLRSRLRSNRRPDYGGQYYNRPHANVRPSPPATPTPQPVAPVHAAATSSDIVPARVSQQHQPAFSVEVPLDHLPAAEQPLLSKVPKRKKKNTAKKAALSFAVLVMIGSIGAGGFFTYPKWKHIISDNNTQETQTLGVQTPEQQSEEPEAAPAPASGTLRFVAVGDTLAFTTVNNAAKKPDGSYDFSPMLASMSPLLDKADMRLCHQSTPAAGDAFGIAGYPSFNAPTSLADGLVASGCNMISLSSDHINDKGQAAIDVMAQYWKNQDGLLAYSGVNTSPEEQKKIQFFTVKEKKFALLTYTTSTRNKSVTSHGINQYSDALATEQIKAARDEDAFVIVAIHWGAEDNQAITPEQERIAQHLAAQNADIVIGSGPHVVQPVKVLEGPEKHQTLVWFSLGNYLNSQLPVNNLTSCMAVMDISLPSGTIVNPSCMPLYMHYEWTPEQKRRGSEADLLARKNLQVVPLDKASDLLPKSQLGTTVEAQTERIKSIVTTFVPIKIMKSEEYLNKQ